MHSTTLITIATTIFSLATNAQNLTTSLLIFDAVTGFDYYASIIASDPIGGETLSITCLATSTSTTSSLDASSTSDSDDSDSDGDDCGLAEGMTWTFGPTPTPNALDLTYVEPTAFTLSVHCDVNNAASTARCTEIAGGSEANFPGTSIYQVNVIAEGLDPAGAATDGGSLYTDLTYFPVTITDGLSKLVAAAETSSSAGAGSSSAAPAASATASSAVASVTGGAGLVAGDVSASSASGVSSVGLATANAATTASAAATSASGAVSSGLASATSVVPSKGEGAAVSVNRVYTTMCFGVAVACAVAMLAL